MFRHRIMPHDLRGQWAAFQVQAERVEQARRALLSCLPVGRVDPAPVPVGLDLLADELRAVAAEMSAWRRPELERQWAACRAAVDDAVAAVPAAHRVATTSTELEELLGAVAEVVEPLDAWSDAERAWRAQRVRPGRAGGCPARS
jgi:hypothetical protein